MAERRASTIDVSRREFLVGTSIAATGIVSPVAARLIQKRPQQTRAPALVVIHLAGGNDPWNCVLGSQDSNLALKRPTLLTGLANAAAISGTLRLHPSLAAIGTLMSKKQVSIQCGVSVPTAYDTHAHLVLAWHEAALPGARPRDGWIVRAVEESPEPIALWADTQSPPRAMRRYGRSGAPQPRVGSLIEYGQVASLSQCLERAADRLVADPGRCIFHLTQTGYDTHEDQTSQHSQCLQEFSSSLSGFGKRLALEGQSARVLTVAYSECGRTLSENELGGTNDDPHSIVFAMGNSVIPGIHGELAPSNRSEIDFRSIHATMLYWMGIDAGKVLTGSFAVAPFLSARRITCSAGQRIS